MNIQGLHSIIQELVIKPHTSIAALKRHKYFKAAKRGNMANALTLATDLLKLDKITMAKDAILVPVLAIEASGRNAIPLAMAKVISDYSHTAYSTDIIQDSKAFHTGAKAIDRLMHPVAFSGPVKQNAKYIIIDDVATSGSTLISLRNYIEDNGGHVIAAIALAVASHKITGTGAQLSITDDTVKSLLSKFGEEIVTFVANELGYETLYQLSNSQGRYLLSFGSINSIRKKISSHLGSQIGEETRYLNDREKADLRQWAAQIRSLSTTSLSGPSTSNLLFHCSACGECCRRIGNAIDSAKNKAFHGNALNAIDKALVDFPYPIRTDGSCSKLNNITNECTVYDQRPDVCSVKKTFQMMQQDGLIHKDVPEALYMGITGTLCNQWQEESGTDKSYRVKEVYDA